MVEHMLYAAGLKDVTVTDTYELYITPSSLS
jgi:hypothetical protein